MQAAHKLIQMIAKQPRRLQRNTLYENSIEGPPLKEFECAVDRWSQIKHKRILQLDL